MIEGSQRPPARRGAQEPGAPDTGGAGIYRKYGVGCRMPVQGGRELFRPDGRLLVISFHIGVHLLHVRRGGQGGVQMPGTVFSAPCSAEPPP